MHAQFRGKRHCVWGGGLLTVVLSTLRELVFMHRHMKKLEGTFPPLRDLQMCQGGGRLMSKNRPVGIELERFHKTVAAAAKCEKMEKMHAFRWHFSTCDRRFREESCDGGFMKMMFLFVSFRSLCR